jgi:hypothetical protein
MTVGIRETEEQSRPGRSWTLAIGGVHQLTREFDPAGVATGHRLNSTPGLPLLSSHSMLLSLYTTS